MTGLQVLMWEIWHAIWPDPWQFVNFLAGRLGRLPSIWAAECVVPPAAQLPHYLHSRRRAAGLTAACCHRRSVAVYPGSVAYGEQVLLVTTASRPSTQAMTKGACADQQEPLA